MERACDYAMGIGKRMGMDNAMSRGIGGGVSGVRFG
jgi:hypothetical protein